jgi:hypothetical protein
VEARRVFHAQKERKMSQMNPFTALAKGNVAAAALGLGNVFDGGPILASLNSHPRAPVWHEEEKYDGSDEPPPIAPAENPLIAIANIRREIIGRNHNELHVDRLLDVLDRLEHVLRDHPAAPAWKCGLVAYVRTDIAAERAAPGTIHGVDPQFTGGR